MSVNNDDYPDNPALAALNSRYVTSEALDTPVYTRNSKHYLASDAMNKLLDSEYKQYKMEKEQGSSRDLDEIDISEIKSPTFSAENSRYTESQALENTTYYRNSQKYTKDVEGARQDLSRGSTPTESPIMSPKFQSQHSRTVQSEVCR